MNGWIKLHRRFLSWEWFDIPNMVHLFIFLVLSANHEDGHWQGKEIKRGQLITGLHSLAEKTGISPQSLRTCFERLKSTGEITYEATNRFRLITVTNYEKYQFDEREPTSKTLDQLTINQQSINNQSTTNNKDKKEKKVSVGHFVPPTLLEVQTYCTERVNGIDAQRFIDHYSARGWMIGKTKMKDWRAAIRTWEGYNKDKPQFTPQDDPVEKLKEKYREFNPKK